MGVLSIRKLVLPCDARCISGHHKAASCAETISRLQCLEQRGLYAVSMLQSLNHRLYETRAIGPTCDQGRAAASKEWAYSSFESLPGFVDVVCMSYK